jgi:hypothetical protein
MRENIVTMGSDEKPQSKTSRGCNFDKSYYNFEVVRQAESLHGSHNFLTVSEVRH